MYHKTSNILIALGVLITLAAFYIMTFDQLIGFLGIAVGLWNIYKGIRLRKNPVPYMIEKHEQEKDEKIKKLRDNHSHLHKK